MIEAPAPASITTIAAGHGGRLVFLLVAFTPVIFALSTWDAAQPGVLAVEAARHFSAPVVAVELIAIFYAMASGFEPGRTLRATPRWMQACLALIGLITFATAALVAADAVNGMVRTCTTAIHLLFGLASAHLMGSRSDWRASVWPFVVAGVSVYILTIPIFVAAIPDPAAFDWLRFGYAVTNIRQTGFYAAVGASAALGLAIGETRRGRFVGWVGAMCLCFALCFWSGTRGSVVAVVAAFVLGLALLPSLRTVRGLVALPAAIAVGAALSLLRAPPDPHFGMGRISSSLSRDEAEAVSSGRVSMWTGTLKAIAERPLFGHGESQFRVVVPEALGIFNHPHNVVLQAALQWGVIGALCFFSLAEAIWWRCLQHARRDPRRLAPALLVVNALLVFSLYEGAIPPLPDHDDRTRDRSSARPRWPHARRLGNCQRLPLIHHSIHSRPRGSSRSM